MEDSVILNEKYFIEGKDFNNKKVLIRVDYNVPVDENGNITDNTRIIASLPTLNYLLNSNAKVIIISHRGRPKGKRNPAYSLKVIEKELEKILIKKGIDLNSIKFIDDCIGEKVKKEIDLMEPKDILILENLRFYEEEKKNDKEFAKKLASLADCYVSDAFGVVHRAHASVAGVPEYIPYYYGYLIKTEVENLNHVLHKKQSPLIAIIGGAKISGKIDVLKSLIKKANFILIGGAMAYTFLKSKGLDVGNSLVEDDKIKIAYDVLLEAEKSGVRLILPLDHIVVDDIKNYNKKSKTPNAEIPDGKIGVYIGPKTIKVFGQAIAKAKTIFWNGPMGIFEKPPFDKGTNEIAKKVADSQAYSVVGGGDSASAIRKSGVADKINHISTGGGASLEFLEGRDLPGIKALEKRKN